MHAEYIGGGAACEKTKLPGPCVGQSEAECAGAFLGDATEGGTPQVCLGVNAGVSVFRRKRGLGAHTDALRSSSPSVDRAHSKWGHGVDVILVSIVSL